MRQSELYRRGRVLIGFFLFVILLLFGAKKIPELAKGLGKGIREFKDATKEVKDEIDKAGETANPEKQA